MTGPRLPERADGTSSLSDGRAADRLAVLTRVSGVGFAAIGIAALSELWWHRLPVWDDTGLGPAFAPGVLAAVLGVLGLLMALGRVAPPAPDDEEEERPRVSAMLTFTLLLVALIVSFPYLGGVLALSLFVSLEMRLVERSSWLTALLSGIGAVLLIWLVFVRILAVPLPRGLLSLLG